MAVKIVFDIIAWNYVMIWFCKLPVKKFGSEERVLGRWDLDIPKERNKSSLGVIEEEMGAFNKTWDLGSWESMVSSKFKGPKPLVLIEIHVHNCALCTFSFFSLSVTIMYFCICSTPSANGEFVGIHFSLSWLRPISTSRYPEQLSHIMRTKLWLGFKPHIHHSWSGFVPANRLM